MASQKELPPGLSEAQIRLLRYLASPEAFEKETHEADAFANLVVQQMDHLMAKVAEQDEMLKRLEDTVSILEQKHISEHAAHAATGDQGGTDEPADAWHRATQHDIE